MRKGNSLKVDVVGENTKRRRLMVEALFIMKLVKTNSGVNFDGDFPKEIILEDKNTVEQMQLIQQLDEDDKTTVLKIIDKMLATKKFKDFFQKNVAAL